MNLKRKWLSSLFSLILCITLLIGSTLAWFVDTVHLTGTVEAGRFKIDLLKYIDTEYRSIRDSQDNIFADSEQGESWYPGRTDILYLAVKNLEDIPAKYRIIIDIAGVEEDGVFQYALFDGVKKDSPESILLDNAVELNPIDQWDRISGIDGVQTGNIVSGQSLAAPNGYLDMNETDYFALAVNMNYLAGNEYQACNVNINVTVEAVQWDGKFEDSDISVTNVLMKEDFERSVGVFQDYSNSNTIKRVQDTDENWYLLLERTAATEMHLTARNLEAVSDVMVIEFDFKVLAEGSQVRIVTFGEHTQDHDLAMIAKDNTFRFADQVVTPGMNTWHTFAAAINYAEGTIDYYYDGVKAASGQLPAELTVDNKVDTFRFHGTIYGAFGVGNVEFTDPLKIGIDNVRIYEASAPVADISNVERTINITDESVFADDSDIVNSLSGYIAFHKRSGVVTVDGRKYILETVPAVSGTDTLIKSSELAGILGVTLPATVPVEMDAEDFFTEVLNKSVVTDSTTLNSGMIIVGDGNYELPSDSEELQELNDYLFYLRPSDSMILELYNNSSSKAVHPRIHGTADDFARVRQVWNNGSDPDMYEWAENVIDLADYYAKEDVVFYELRDGVRLLGVSREVLDKMYAFGMAYQLTQDQKYADRGFEELKAVCEFPGWHPSHALDVGEMAAAVAIGYDWLYEGLTPEQRKVVERGIYNHAFYDSMIMYQTGRGYMSGACYQDSGFNTVVGGGLALAALATLDVYPEVSSRILQHAVRASEEYLALFAPEGTWYEGPGYWDDIVTYMVKKLNALETVLGTDLGLSMSDGLSKTALFAINAQSDLGTFTYGDDMSERIYTPEMFYLANKYQEPVISAIVMDKTGGSMTSGEHTALSLLWYDANCGNADYSSLPLDAVYYGDAVAFLHESFQDEDVAFAGFHGGNNAITHSHLDSGSFVFDSDGVRWAVELGLDNYNQPGYWDETDNGKRWQIFRMRAEAHNTLVINSTPDQDQEFQSWSPITRFESGEDGAIVVSDLTDAYRSNATKVHRGIQFADDRSSLVVRDEITLKNSDSEVYWFMLTDSDVTVDSADDGLTHQAILTKDGKSLAMDFVTTAPAELSCAVAEPLHDETTFYTVETVKRIALKVSDVSGDLNITVKLTPESVSNPTAVADYDIGMSNWEIQ